MNLFSLVSGITLLLNLLTYEILIPSQPTTEQVEFQSAITSDFHQTNSQSQNSQRFFMSPKSDSLHDAIIELTLRSQGTFGIAYINLQDPSDTLFINADEMFHAASTMKTPVLIEAYKQATAGGLSIQDSMLVHNSFTSIADGSKFSVELDRDSGKEIHSRIGEYVPIREILYDMTINSGNLSTNLIIDKVDAKKVTQTMRDLGASKIEVLRGVEDMKAFEAGLSNRTSARDLAIIFQHLAKGTAVSREASNDMINILLDQQFKEMIPAKLPKSVKVAHKTGWISGVVHDSGIVMLEDGRQYVLVILSKNLEQNDLGTDIGAEISEAVYHWFNRSSN